MRWYRAAHMWAFDLIELDGTDMRRDPLATRKAKLADLLGRLRLDCGLTSTWTRKMAPSSSIMPASSAWRGSCRSAAIRRIAPVGRDIGSRARTRTRPRFCPGRHACRRCRRRAIRGQVGRLGLHPGEYSPFRQSNERCRRSFSDGEGQFAQPARHQGCVAH
jgi:hypothetical protein